jgi:hypothetical protein
MNKQNNFYYIQSDLIEHPINMGIHNCIVIKIWEPEKNTLSFVRWRKIIENLSLVRYNSLIFKNKEKRYLQFYYDNYYESMKFIKLVKKIINYSLIEIYGKKLGLSYMKRFNCFLKL